MAALAADAVGHPGRPALRARAIEAWQPQEIRLAISAADADLTHALHRSPTVTEVAAHLNLTEEEVLEGLEAARAYSAISLSMPLGLDGESGGISQMHVSRLIARALLKLRHHLEADGNGTAVRRVDGGDGCRYLYRARSSCSSHAKGLPPVTPSTSPVT